MNAIDPQRTQQHARYDAAYRSEAPAPTPDIAFLEKPSSTFKVPEDGPSISAGRICQWARRTTDTAVAAAGPSSKAIPVPCRFATVITL